MEVMGVVTHIHDISGKLTFYYSSRYDVLNDLIEEVCLNER